MVDSRNNNLSKQTYCENNYKVFHFSDIGMLVVLQADNEVDKHLRVKFEHTASNHQRADRRKF